MRLLYQHDGDKSEWRVLPSRKITIGRDSVCDIVVQDPKVSRVHAEILFEDGQYVYVDKNSTNGSFINGNRITRQILMPGDIIILGSKRLILMEGTDSNRIEWTEEGEGLQIAAQVPLDSISKKISQITALYQEKAAVPRETKSSGSDFTIDFSKTQKLLNNLNVIYHISRVFTSVMVFSDLYALVEKYMYEIFPQLERFCLLALSEDRKKFVPKYLSCREPEDKSEFKISRSIFKLTVEKKIGVLTEDAGRDDRFRHSESVIGLSLRSIMCAPLVLKNRVIGGIYCDNRTQPSCFDNEDLELLIALANHIAVAYENARLYEEVQRSYHEAILALINAIEAKDPYTMGHTQRTSRYALGVAQELALNEKQCQRLKTAAELHDIGKIGVKERIISKGADLTDTEFHSIRQHVLMGEKILTPITYLHYVVPIIRGHHEHYDGSGYPDGLKGNEILLESRILSVADAFDAMTTQRPYNAPLSFAGALEECKKHAGTQFDPTVLEALERFIAANYELTDSSMFDSDHIKGETYDPFL